MNTWVFLRHGESTANRARQLSGWEDVALTALGRSQARDAGRALWAEGLCFDRVLSSDLVRAHDTATLALEAYVAHGGGPPPPIELDGRLRERNMGRYQGASYDAMREAGIMARMITWAQRPPGGESHADLARRVVGALAAHEAAGVSGSVLFVAHGGVIRTLLGLLDGEPRAEIGKTHVANATPLRRAVGDGAWQALFAELEPEG